MSRPRHIPTAENRKLAETVSGLGLPHEQIGALIGIDDKTLRKHYRHELDQGIAKANSNVVKSLYSKASGGDVTACIWWTKTRLGWKDTSRTEISGIREVARVEIIVKPHEAFAQAVARAPAEVQRLVSNLTEAERKKLVAEFSKEDMPDGAAKH